eukprot:7204518-Prorocentrum_lima.AAC.1
MAQQAVARSAHATVLVQLRPSWALGSSRQVMGDPAFSIETLWLGGRCFSGGEGQRCERAGFLAGITGAAM